MTLKPEQSFRSHRWSSIAVTATSVISSYTLRIAANPVFRRVHLRAYTLAAALAITFVAILVSVALNTRLSSRRRSLAKRLAWSTASPVAVALPSISAEQGVRSIEKNLPGFPVAEHFNAAGHSIDDALVRGMMLSVDNAQRKRLEMRLIFQLGTSQPRGLNSDFRFL